MTSVHAAANLPSFFEGARFDLKWRNFTADLDFWIRQARKYGGPVLDLVCGTGRVSLHLTRAGFRVTGIDSSETLLREAARKCLRLSLSAEWVKHDIREFDLGTRFPLVILPGNAIATFMETKDLEACFACVKRHLAPKGKVVIDLFNPDLEILSRDPKERFPHARYPAHNGRGMVVVTESNSYDTVRQVNLIRRYHKMPREARELVEEFAVRVYFPQELNSLLKYNGFLIEAKYGDYDESAFGAESPKQLIVCSVPL